MQILIVFTLPEIAEDFADYIVKHPDLLCSKETVVITRTVVFNCCDPMRKMDIDKVTKRFGECSVMSKFDSAYIFNPLTNTF